MDTVYTAINNKQPITVLPYSGQVSINNNACECTQYIIWMCECVYIYMYTV